MKRDSVLLIALLSLSVMLIVFSQKTHTGALQGLILAQETIIPSLLAPLIIFLMIMNTGAGNALARLLGFVSVKLFKLPKSTLPVIFLGLIGGYPTGALLTRELLKNNEISFSQARRMLKFNFCGGCGFIVTAVGYSHFSSTRAGVMLLLSNILSSLVVAVILSLFDKEQCSSFNPFGESMSIANALVYSVESAIKSVLSITAFIILFSAIEVLVNIPTLVMPLVEITNGIFNNKGLSLPLVSAYLSFGGICVHMQLLPAMAECKMKYTEFLFYRLICAVISYGIMHLLLLVSPVELAVFSNQSQTVASFSSVNLTLSILMITGSLVLVLDLSSRKKYC